MLPELTLVLGGAASGKSLFAESLAKKTGRKLMYLATADIHDNEMRAKVYKHRETRGPGWKTVEATLDPGPALTNAPGDHVVLMDCATMWLSNNLLAGSDMTEAEASLMISLRMSAASVIVVSNEVGSSVVPDNALARQFRDAQGALNQRLAAKAGLVVNVVAGLPLVLKGTLP